MVGYIPSSFFACLWTQQSELHQLIKKKRYSVILTEQTTWSIKDLLYGFRGNFSCRIQRLVLSEEDLDHPDWASDGSRQVIVLIPLGRISKPTTETMHLAPKKQQLLQRDHDNDDKQNCNPRTNAAVLIKLQRHERKFG